ncbi:hypothetical protein HMPREF9944_02062 [Segatella maculosa OT 289]|uniref:Uncharacterized protein n=1 Tax=Segatella maculosa OT 289 TaxID=999422 RepID=H1HPG8_9BACT|nr:hypothetical protein HMPREF9944_02062 [Segatella maculosa OT 289]
MFSLIIIGKIFVIIFNHYYNHSQLLIVKRFSCLNFILNWLLEYLNTSIYNDQLGMFPLRGYYICQSHLLASKELLCVWRSNIYKYNFENM